MGSTQHENEKKIRKEKKKKKKKHMSQPAPKFWRPGTPFSETDKELLALVVQKSEELGRNPHRADMDKEIVGRLKNRFHTWFNILEMAGLPVPERLPMRPGTEINKSGDLKSKEPLKSHMDSQIGGDGGN
ncbi:MAG: hypothetical protein LBS85_01870 [Clostridiales Family XIII bacterium]|nr:hypothetical protein [Clostridiales Family XIII bacterium]